MPRPKTEGRFGGDGRPGWSTTRESFVSNIHRITDWPGRSRLAGRRAIRLTDVLSLFEP